MDKSMTYGTHGETEWTSDCDEAHNEAKRLQALGYKTVVKATPTESSFWVEYEKEGGQEEIEPSVE